MSEQAPTLGQLSHDEYWYWNGANWVPSVSPDRRWRWDGRRWTTLSPVSTKKAWTRRDRLALGGWAAAILAASAVCNQLVFRGGGTHASAGFVAFLVAVPLLMGLVAGLLIRRDGPPSEAFGLAAFGAVWPAITLFVAWTSDSSACTAPAGADCDTGLGLGAVLIFAACYLPFLAGTAAGKLFGARSRTTQPIASR